MPKGYKPNKLLQIVHLKVILMNNWCENIIKAKNSISSRGVNSNEFSILFHFAPFAHIDVCGIWCSECKGNWDVIGNFHKSLPDSRVYTKPCSCLWITREAYFRNCTQT